MLAELKCDVNEKDNAKGPRCCRSELRVMNYRGTALQRIHLLLFYYASPSQAKPPQGRPFQSPNFCLRTLRG